MVLGWNVSERISNRQFFLVWRKDLPTIWSMVHAGIMARMWWQFERDSFEDG